jgi:hypothetical protein
MALYTKFHDDWFRHSGNINVIYYLVNLRVYSARITKDKDCDFCRSNKPSFMMVDSGVHVILKKKLNSVA